MTVNERLAALRRRMSEEGVDAYLVPTDDYHNSEYVGDFFKCRKFLTGFTGSAGTAVVTKDDACLWTDGRYFLQAGKQLEGSDFRLMKIGEEGVPTIDQYVTDVLSDGETFGFDGRCMSAGKGDRFERELKKKGVKIVSQLDLVGDIWEDRPARSMKPVWELGVGYTGKSRADKLADLRKAMAEKGAQYHLLTSLDDIAWLLNLRGDDIACNPVFLAYLAVTPDEVLLFAQRGAFTDELPETLKKDTVRLLPYEDFYAFIAEIPAETAGKKTAVLLDSTCVNYQVWKSVPEGVRRIDSTNPTLLPKSIKTPVEMQHMREAHIKDGVAVTKFRYWLEMAKRDSAKNRDINAAAGKNPDYLYEPGTSGENAVVITEISASDKLEEFRRQGEHFLGLSFDTICSWGYHAAIVHYSATPETDIPVENHSFLLVDSGGQYLEGTTDITRTFVLGETTDEEKEFYTRVLMGHLNLAAAKFKYGTSGTALDYLARGPLWEIGKDYNHGTGHGVGYLLNVHEGPNSVSYKEMQGRRKPAVFEEGMITSDEPGFYLEGKFGIRHENLTMCRKAGKNEYGQFMDFEILTKVPFDREAIIPELMTEKQKKTLNAYHKDVYETISPYLTDDEREWLRQETAEI